MNAEFNLWLLIVGLVIGAGLVYLVLADSVRREVDVAADELPREATWIAAELRAEGRRIDPPTAERVLELHRAYLAAPPPDADEAPDASEAEAAPGSVGRDRPHVERDAAEPQPPVADVHQPRRAQGAGE